MRAKASVSPVRAVPWPWKSIHHLDLGACEGRAEKSPWAVFCLAFVNSHAGQSAKIFLTLVFIPGHE